MDPDFIFWGSFIFAWLVFLWDEYLALRQYRTYVRTTVRPKEVESILDEKSFSKSRLYKIDKSHFGFIASIYGQIESSVVLLAGLLPFFWNLSGNFIDKFGFSHEILQSIAFASVLSVIEFFLGLPWSWYDTFVIEEKHGFNKQTLGFFIKDKIKKLFIMFLLEVPIISVIIWIIQKGGPYFFFYVWIFMSIMILFLMTIYPEFIAPLFDKYTPLPDGVLRTKIEALAERLTFPLKKLYVVEGSKRSAHSNAYLYGIWNNKRIVLYDTLLQDYTPVQREDKEIEETKEEEVHDDEKKEEVKEAEENNEESKETETKEDTNETEEKPAERKKLGMSNDEVVAVLGHELGHWKLNHVTWNLVISELNLLFMLAVFGYFYQQKEMYVAFGFVDSQPTLIGLLVVFQFIFAPYNELLSFLMTWWTRQKEFAADAFSAELGYASLLISGLIKLSKDNLSFPVNDWLYSWWNHDHPPVLERIDAMKKYE